MYPPREYAISTSQSSVASSLSLWNISWLRRTILSLLWHASPFKNFSCACILVPFVHQFLPVNSNTKLLLVSKTCRTLASVHSCRGCPRMSPFFNRHSKLYITFMSLCFYFFWKVCYLLTHWYFGSVFTTLSLLYLRYVFIKAHTTVWFYRYFFFHFNKSLEANN